MKENESWARKRIFPVSTEEQFRLGNKSEPWKEELSHWSCLAAQVKYSVGESHKRRGPLWANGDNLSKKKKKKNKKCAITAIWGNVLNFLKNQNTYTSGHDGKSAVIRTRYRETNEGRFSFYVKAI